MVRTIIAVVDDMVFASKILATGKALGLIVRSPRTLDALRDTLNEERPSLILVDLHNQKLDPVALARELKADDNHKTIPLVGFFSHVQVGLQKEANEAGFDEVMPRSIFARDLANILAGQIKGR